MATGSEETEGLGRYGGKPLLNRPPRPPRNPTPRPGHLWEHNPPRHPSSSRRVIHGAKVEITPYPVPNGPEPTAESPTIKK